MKRFEQISKGDLKKYPLCQCRCKIFTWNIIEWEIYVEDDFIFILHNNLLVDWWRADNLKWYEYSRQIYSNGYSDEAMNNNNYEWIEIEFKNPLKHNEVEVNWIVYRKVYVSDESVEKALEVKDERILIKELPW
jgi:hypothetical protein